MDTTKTQAVHPLLVGTSRAPWVEVHGNTVRDADGKLIATLIHRHTRLKQPHLPEPMEAQANARIFAAAPTLAAENAKLRAALEEITQFEHTLGHTDFASVFFRAQTKAREVLASLST